jgi:hypothetical protein
MKRRGKREVGGKGEGGERRNEERMKGIRRMIKDIEVDGGREI